MDGRSYRNITCCLILLAGALFLILNPLSPTTSASIYAAFLAQSSATVKSPPVILQPGTAGTGTIYANGTSARVNVAAPAPNPTYYPNNHNVLSGDWWGTDYAYRRKVEIRNNAASNLGAGYSVLLTLDTASLVSAGRMLPNGNDLRILYWNDSSSSWLELDRAVQNMNTTSTSVWFKTQASIVAEGLDSNYCMYYGFSSAGGPPIDQNKVYLFYDDFSGATLDSGKWAVLSGTPTIESGELSLSGSVELRTVSSFDRGYVCEQDVKAQADGAHVRVNIIYADAANNYHAHLDTNGLRLHNGLDVQLGASVAYVRPSNHLLRFTVTSNTLRAELINKGDSSVLWDSGTVTDSAQAGARPVGFRFSFLSGTIHFHYDNLKIRDYVSPEPSVSLGGEELPYHSSGTVPASVRNVDSDCLVTRSAGSETVTSSYCPYTHTLGGSTALVSGSVSDLTLNDGLYMTFRSYASMTSAQALYSHQENTIINATSYYMLDFSSADAAGTTLLASAGTTGRKLMGQFVKQLTGVSSIPASTWTSYYRAYRGSGVTAHGDVDILIRMPNDTVRTTIATNVANSGALSTFWSTVSGTYAWAAYTVVDQADYLEIDYYIDVTTASAGSSVYLRIDSSGLPTTSQTRTTNIYLPSEYTSEVEFTGSANTESWMQLEQTIDLAWTVGSVSVTVQAYDYTSGGYPTSGNGYYGYTSSSTANTDETRIRIITIDPIHFRNESCNWKIRVTGSKITTTQFDFKADWIEFKPTHYIEFAASTEFLFSGMTTNTPAQLNFTVVSEYDITNVSATIEVWNYSSSAYVTSGEGYLTYAAAGANETRLLSINVDPQSCTSDGFAKIKVTGVYATTTEFQQEINQIKLTYEYIASPTYDYVLKVVNKVSTNWTLNLQVYNSSNIGRLSNATISLHDGTSNVQIIINDGNVTKLQGEPHNLQGGTGSTAYISISNLQATNTDTSYLSIYLKVLVPGKTSYSLYVVTFEVT